MIVLKANLDEQEAKRLGDMISLGACEIFVEEVLVDEYKLLIKFKSGHMVVKIDLDEVES
jgi:hypothetical protein